MNTEKYLRICRKVAAEGCVLLENDGVLPFLKSDKIAVFGREQFEYVKSGSGSGGNVQCEYVTDINSCLREEIKIDEQVENFYKDFIKDNPYDVGDGWHVPPVQKQPKLCEDFVKSAASRCDKALIVISRVFGEGFDMHVIRDEYLLSEEEEKAIALITEHFKQVAVIINSGNLIDLSWVKKYDVNGLIFAWQGGQEGGAAAADVLLGKVNPSGKLPSSSADLSTYDEIPFGSPDKNKHIEDIYVGYRYLLTFHPEKIVYPFGYGLSYTSFSIKTENFAIDGETVKITVKVTNIGKSSGKQTLQIYFSAPQGKLGKAKRELVAFKKTKNLAPNEEQTLNFEFNAKNMCAFDDKNACGFGRAFVLESGDYEIFVGTDCVNCKKAGVYALEKDVCVKKTSDALHPAQNFTRITPFGNETVEGYPRDEKTEIPEEIPYSGDKGYTLKDVESGKCSLDEFIAQLPPDQLACLCRGEGWGSAKACVAGAAGVMGGITDCLKNHGVPVITLCDGPSGPRTTDGTQFVCIPVGTLLASTWDLEGIAEIFKGFSDELSAKGIDVILAPGVNIHRHPCGGRNFEYFSEDPLLAGSFAAAVCSHFYDNGIIAVPKHFAVNSQENGREGENEILSERALREIYLKPFEIAVKSGKILAIMTSYNRINGLTACSNAGLTDIILRREWGYKGFVMSDWWAKADKYDGTFDVKNVSQMIKAQNDALMVTPDALNSGDDVLEELEKGNLKLSEIQRCAKHMLECIMQTQTFKKGKFACKNEANGKNANDDDKEKIIYSLDVNNNSIKMIGSGKVTAEAVYSTKTSGLDQPRVQIFVNGIEKAAFTAQQTGGEMKTARFTLSASYGDEINFSDNVTIHKINVFHI